MSGLKFLALDGPTARSLAFGIGPDRRSVGPHLLGICGFLHSRALTDQHAMFDPPIARGYI